MIARILGSAKRAINAPNAPQTAQMARANGPDMGQRVRNRATNAPNTPFSDGMRRYAKSDTRMALLRPATKWRRVPTIERPARLSRLCANSLPATPAIVRSVTGQFQSIEAERIERDTPSCFVSTDLPAGAWAKAGNRPTTPRNRPISGARSFLQNLSIIYRRFREIYRWRLSPNIAGAPEYPQPIRNRPRGYPQLEVDDG